MKKIVLSVLLISAAAGLAACAGTESGQYPAPYAHERTAGGERNVRAAEPVFDRQLTK